MKRYIDLRDQTGNIDYQEGEREFAFYCTVTDTFESFDTTQTWTNKGDLIEDMRNSGRSSEIDRFISLIPE